MRHSKLLLAGLSTALLIGGGMTLSVPARAGDDCYGPVAVGRWSVYTDSYCLRSIEASVKESALIETRLSVEFGGSPLAPMRMTITRHGTMKMSVKVGSKIVGTAITDKNNTYAGNTFSFTGTAMQTVYNALRAQKKVSFDATDTGGKVTNHVIDSKDFEAAVIKMTKG